MSDKILAFCHIEKAAGTSLTHVLRRLFFLRYATVRPMLSSQCLYFGHRDLQLIRRLHSRLQAFGGHSVVPRGDLMNATHQLTFITQLREPVARATSQYRYWVEHMKLDSDSESFLRHPVSQNFQVKKIAGCEDVGLAKKILEERFLVAGTADRFDEFLVFLAKKLGRPLHQFTYRKMNVNKNASPIDISDSFYERLKNRNRLDQQLYDWVRTDLHEMYLADYGASFSEDLAKLRTYNQSSFGHEFWRLPDSLYRNLLLKPVSGVIRMWHGLPYQGSYATE